MKCYYNLLKIILLAGALTAGIGSVPAAGQVTATPQDNEIFAEIDRMMGRYDYIGALAAMDSLITVDAQDSGDGQSHNGGRAGLRGDGGHAGAGADGAEGAAEPQSAVPQEDVPLRRGGGGSRGGGRTGPEGQSGAGDGRDSRLPDPAGRPDRGPEPLRDNHHD